LKNYSQNKKFLLVGVLSFLAVTALPYLVSFYSRVDPGLSRGYARFYGAGAAINDLARWYAHFLNRSSAKPFNIVGISADDYSSKMLGQRWPFKRSAYAGLIRVLDKEGARVIGFDLIFSGDSADKQDDLELSSALKESSCRVVLASAINYQNGTLISLPDDIRNSAFAEGFINTPADPDEVIRKLRDEFVDNDGKKYYSLSVQTASAYLDKPAKEIAASIPRVKLGEYLINYLFIPGDRNRAGRDIVKTVNLYQVLDPAELGKLKKEYGEDFLKGSLAFVYPAGDMAGDIKLTPFGKLPGGITHINGAANIITGRFLGANELIGFFLLVVCFAAVFYILTRSGFIAGILLTLGMIMAGLWLAVVSIIHGIFFDLSRPVIFCAVFFAAGSLYKYLYFFSQLLKIKSKATMDPLRGIFTLRYFYYQLELESKKMYFNRDLYLVFVRLGSFRPETSGMNLNELKNLWQSILPVISVKDSFWSTYSPEELVAGIYCPASRIAPTVKGISNGLEVILKEKQVNAVVRAGFVRYKRDYPVKELLFAAFRDIGAKPGEPRIFSDNELAGMFKSQVSQLSEGDKILDSLDQDIEEKNRELLGLVENLSKEHARAKEIFFQVITSLVNALEARDPYTMGHSQRVCNYALRLADRLGWNKEEKEKLQKAALLHDLGKIGIPDSILHKTGRLTDEEFDFIKKHEIIAVKILEPIKDIADILDWILYHHERWDGKGYPHGLGGNAIPLASQIISIADVFDALTTGRDYKQALSYEESMGEIVKNKGLQFKPELVDVFVEEIKAAKA